MEGSYVASPSTMITTSDEHCSNSRRTARPLPGIGTRVTSAPARAAAPLVSSVETLSATRTRLCGRYLTKPVTTLPTVSSSLWHGTTTATSALRQMQSSGMSTVLTPALFASSSASSPMPTTVSGVDPAGGRRLGGLDRFLLVDPEDEKLVTLARATRARTGAAEGGAVRDDTGRTYAAATVALESLSLSALQAAVAAAVSSGVQQLEAAALVTDAETVAGDDARVLAELGVDAASVADGAGKVRA